MTIECPTFDSNLNWYLGQIDGNELSPTLRKETTNCIWD
jgi:hypothetical protein